MNNIKFDKLTSPAIHFKKISYKLLYMTIYEKIFNRKLEKSHSYVNQQSSKVKEKEKREREREKEGEAKKKKENVDNFERRSCETKRNETGVAEGQCQISDTVDNPVQTKH